MAVASSALLWLVGCASYYVPEGAESRPGLAAGFGEKKESLARPESFVRAEVEPAGRDMLFYNDGRGLTAMALDARPASPSRTVAGGLVEWGLKGSFGFWPTFEDVEGRRYVRGREGRPFSIYLKNLSRSRLELVVSVDGLDVMDGRPASVKKRGYLLRPGESITIDGWRTSESEVARFEFTSVGASYAQQRHGDARNAGVIGLAVFREKGVDPWEWMPGEVRQRRGAQAFATDP